MKKYYLITCGLFLLLLSGLSLARPTSIDIFAAYIYGPVNGFVQIPAGGQPGTSSIRQPTFSDLDIKHCHNYDLEADINWYNISLYGGYQYIRPQGLTTLDKSIVTHGVLIPAGSKISTDLKFDYYRLGGRYSFYLWQNKLIIAPLIEADILDFRYAIPDMIDPRQFKQITTRIGLYSAYYFKPQFFLDGTFAVSIPVFNLNMLTAQLRLNYVLFNRSAFSPTLFIGGQYTYMNFKDGQTLPNHIEFKQPAILAGLAIKF